MADFSPHDPPRLLVRVHYTCTVCNGSQTIEDPASGKSWCRHCTDGYKEVLLPIAAVMAAGTTAETSPAQAHAYVVEQAALPGAEVRQYLTPGHNRPAKPPTNPS